MTRQNIWAGLITIALIISFLFFWTSLSFSEKVMKIEKQPEKGAAFDIERFIPVETCSDCHSQIFEQWEHSMHSLSHQDPVYSRIAVFFRKNLTDAGEITEAESCVKCHTPVGVVTGFPQKVSDDLSQTPAIATRGIQCDYCHSAVDIKKMYNNGLVLNPGQGEDEPGIKYGPFDDSEPDFHEAQYSKLHTESDICGTCHDVKHLAFGTDLETTYTEWKNSPYNTKDPDTRITCQGCHMFQRPGLPATGSTPRPENPGSATDYSVERPHIFTHYFVGANAAVPAMFGSKQKADMAQERLKNAAALTMGLDKIDGKKLSVTITNTGAGHSIPTGLGDLRQVWLEIILKDQTGQIQYSTGLLDKTGELDENTRMFQTVFGDQHGNPVANVAKARQVLIDTRIKAKESRSLTFDFGFVPQKGSVLTARLLYRSAPQKILKIIPGDPLEPLPVIEMAKQVQSL